MELVEIVSTFATEAEAMETSHRLVGERLAACGSVGAVRSVYRWKESIHDGLEFLLALKTTRAMADRAEARLRELHPYETPAILRVPIAAANPEYAAWVEECVGPAGDAPEGA